MESLRGKLLVASPALQDPNFVRSVVLITEHGDEGAMGIVLNRPADTEVEEVLPELASIAVAEPVFVGGPVQPESLVVLGEFTDPEKAAWIVVADVGLVAPATPSAAPAPGPRQGSVRRIRFEAGGPLPPQALGAGLIVNWPRFGWSRFEQPMATVQSDLRSGDAN